jgi:predicted AlkP superfamily pyrophosphatase or phosphodiesterase
MDQGIDYHNAHYQHANTETIVGHASLATGAVPAAHGMVANVWFDREQDYLAISFSSTDYIGHIFGASSLESEDNLARLDRILAELFAYLDRVVGLDNTLIVLSADHGDRTAGSGREAALGSCANPAQQKVRSNERARSNPGPQSADGAIHHRPAAGRRTPAADPCSW